MLLGLGGIWVEALGDVKFLPVGADERQIVEALHNLRTSKVLAGFRGAPHGNRGGRAVVMAIGRDAPL